MVYFLSKYEYKDQESIQSSTTPDPRHHMEKWKKQQENISHKRAKRQALSQQVTTGLQWRDKKGWQSWNKKGSTKEAQPWNGQ